MKRLAELQAYLTANPKVKKVWINGENWLFNEPMTKTKDAEGKGDDRKPAEYKTTEGWKAVSAKDILATKVKEEASDAGGGADDKEKKAGKEAGK